MSTSTNTAQRSVSTAPTPPGRAPRRGRSAAPTLALLAALGACGGGGGDEASPGAEPRRDPDQGAPTAAGLRFTVAEDETLVGALSDASRPGVPASAPFGLLSAPGRGALELLDDGRAFRYVPEPDFNGTDGFDYGTPEGRRLRATIDVTPLPDEPVLEPVPTLVAERGRVFQATLLARDPDGETLRFEAAGLPDWLALDASTGELLGTPAANAAERVEGLRFAVLDPSGRRDESGAVVLEVIEPREPVVLDLAGVPETLDGGERRVVTILPESFDLDGVDLAVETEPALAARVEGRDLVLEASDVEELTTVTVVVSLTDRLGVTRRAVATLVLRPLSASGRGRTLLGSRSAQARGVNLVVLGDGYRAAEQELLQRDAGALVSLLQSDPGTRRHLAAFNIHVIESVSLDSGADDDRFSDTRDTRFDSYYNCSQVQRLICADRVALEELARAEYGDVREIVLLVNDSRAGGSGSGGSGLSIASRAEPEIALHEMGHSLADLADEYVDGELIGPLAPAFEEGRFPNVTAITDPARVPWAHWIEDLDAVPSAPGEPGVGLFEGGMYRSRGVYRPTATSRMREYAEPFGPVNAEQWVLGIYAIAGIVRDFTPFENALEIVAGESRRFTVTPFFAADVQAIEWSLNGDRIRQADGARELEVAPPAGRYEVSLTVRDVSGLIRADPASNSTFRWDWELTVR